MITIWKCCRGQLSGYTHSLVAGLMSNIWSPFTNSRWRHAVILISFTLKTKLSVTFVLTPCHCSTHVVTFQAESYALNFPQPLRFDRNKNDSVQVLTNVKKSARSVIKGFSFGDVTALRFRKVMLTAVYIASSVRHNVSEYIIYVSFQDTFCLRTLRHRDWFGCNTKRTVASYFLALEHKISLRRKQFFHHCLSLVAWNVSSVNFKCNISDIFLFSSGYGKKVWN